MHRPAFISRALPVAVFALNLAWSCMLLGGEEKPPADPSAPEEAFPIVYGKGRLVCEVDASVLSESSGVACGRANPDIFWTHNDSGSRPVIHAINREGEIVASYKVAGAAARDWEDIASVSIGQRQGAAPRGLLLIADVGDNSRNRADCRIYLVDEPLLTPRAKAPAGTGDRGSRRDLPDTERADVVAFTYEDGPHDCESVAVDPQTRCVYLVSKELLPPCKVYELPLPREFRGARHPLVAKPIAELRIPLATGMDISPDGRRAVIVTYGNAFEYCRTEGESWKDAFARVPRGIAVPPRPQGESICYGPDGISLYLTSEVPGGKGKMPLFEVPAVPPIAPQ